MHNDNVRVSLVLGIAVFVAAAESWDEEVLEVVL